MCFLFYRHQRTEDLVQLATKKNFQLLYGTLIKNIKSYPPTGHTTSIDLAFPALSPDEYRHLDPNDPSNLFRLGRWYESREYQDQANEALVLSKQYTSVIEDVNDTVNNGFKSFCIDYKNLDLQLYNIPLFGKTFDKFCENII